MAVELAPEVLGPRAFLDRELARSEGETPPVCVTVGIDPSLGHAPSVAFGTSGAMAGNRFVYPDGHGHYCRVDPGELSVKGDMATSVDLCCDRFSAKVLLEWVLLPMSYFPLAAQGWAPVHASGMTTTDGVSVMFPAWAGVGKTNLVLAGLLDGRLRTYLGDDTVMVHADGSALPSSRTVSAYGYNRRFVPPLSRAQRARMGAGEIVRRVGSSPGTRATRLKGLLVYAGKAYSNTRVSVPRAREPADFTPEYVSVHARTISDSTVSSPEMTVLAEPPAPRAMARAHVAVLEFEFVQFRRLVETWRWATTSEHDPWSRLVASWADSLEGFFSQPRSYAELRLPTSSYPPEALRGLWSELKNISAQ